MLDKSPNKRPTIDWVLFKIMKMISDGASENSATEPQIETKGGGENSKTRDTVDPFYTNQEIQKLLEEISNSDAAEI